MALCGCAPANAPSQPPRLPRRCAPRPGGALGDCGGGGGLYTASARVRRRVRVTRVRLERADVCGRGPRRHGHQGLRTMNALFLISLLVAGRVQSAPDPLAVARAQFERADYRAAITTLSTAIDVDGHDAALWHWRSRSYLELRDYAR